LPNYAGGPVRNNLVPISEFSSSEYSARNEIFKLLAAYAQQEYPVTVYQTMQI